MSLLLWHGAPQLYRIESPRLPQCSVTAAVHGTAIRETLL